MHNAVILTYALIAFTLFDVFETPHWYIRINHQEQISNEQGGIRNTFPEKNSENFKVYWPLVRFPITTRNCDRIPYCSVAMKFKHLNILKVTSVYVIMIVQIN